MCEFEQRSALEYYRLTEFILAWEVEFMFTGLLMWLVSRADIHKQEKSNKIS